MENAKKEMKICTPEEYDITIKALGKDKAVHKIIYDKNNRRNGYVYTKMSSNNDNYYAPYLVYKVGKKIGINVPETEVAQVHHKTPTSSSESYVEASIVYDENLGDGPFPKINDGKVYVEQEVILDDYLIQNPQKAKIRKEKMIGRESKQVIDDYVDANLYYLTKYGDKPLQEYSRAEIDAIKQELIDRALFGLRFEVQGNFGIVVDIEKDEGESKTKDGTLEVSFGKKGARLEPYYISNHNMYCLNARDEWLIKKLKEDDETFKRMIKFEFIPQYGLMPNVFMPDTEDVIRYIYSKYPEQAKKAYEKLEKFAEKDFKELLDSCTRMSEVHKEFALRVFNMRGREFAQIHQEKMKNWESINR